MSVRCLFSQSIIIHSYRVNVHIHGTVIINFQSSYILSTHIFLIQTQLKCWISQVYTIWRTYNLQLIQITNVVQPQTSHSRIADTIVGYNVYHNLTTPQGMLSLNWVYTGFKHYLCENHWAPPTNGEDYIFRLLTINLT